MIPFWQNKMLDEMTDEEWELLCDGCGLCCLNKLIDEKTDQIFNTNVACDQLDSKTCQCKHYDTRFDYEPDCIKLTKINVKTIPWLPKTCAYNLLLNNQPLFDWHPLIAGNKEKMHNQMISIRNRIVYEKDVIYWEDHILPD
ncbi:YcgN family cysteine cluster protein [Utexia brackfieldae]|uniref:YcgN family cysteine cluster protein n=1 Tax=Utexia brackfieldae TaxID=3074108 RepID=UPI00370D60FD